MKSERIDHARLQSFGQGYAIARSNALKDVAMLAVATEYRREISRRYLQIPASEISMRFTGEGRVAASCKYDGEAVFLGFHADEEPQAFAFNAPSGRVRIGLPCLDELARKLSEAGVQKALLVGEIYLPVEPGGPRPNHSDVLRYSFGVGVAERARFSLALYDIVMLDGQDWRKQQGDFGTVWEELSRLVGPAQPGHLVHRVEGAMVSEKEIAGYFARTVEAGQEGIVVRRLDRLEIVKIKPSLTIDAVVIGYVEDQVGNEYGVASLLSGLTTGEGEICEFARVGSGFSEEGRVRLLRELSALKVEAPLAKTDSDGRPVIFVQPRLLVELHGENLEMEKLSGQENLMPAYRWQDRAYQYLGLVPLPRLIHATFHRFREDKSLEEGGARLEQVVPKGVTAKITASRPAPARVLQREVYVKSAKGQAAVRKFLLLETDGLGRHPYLVVFTDASLGRKEPFQHTLKVASTREDAIMLWQELLAENVKKGWNRHEA